MIESGAEIIAATGGVSGIGGLFGAMIGNRIDVKWIKERLAEHTGKLTAHETFLQAHELEIELLKRSRDGVGG